MTLAKRVWNQDEISALFFHPETPPGGQPPNCHQWITPALLTATDCCYCCLLSLSGTFFLVLIFRPFFCPSSEGNLHCDNVRDTVRENKKEGGRKENPKEKREKRKIEKLLLCCSHHRFIINSR